jgi:hypothetical protein
MLPYPTQASQSCIVSSRYIATTGEQTDDCTCFVVIKTYRVCKSVKLLQLFVVTGYKIQ